MPRIPLALLLPVLAGLAACAGGDRIAMERAQTEGRACVAAMEANPDYAALARHMPLGGDNASGAQLADHAVPGAAERRALASWKADLALCRRPTLEGAGSFAPDGLGALRQAYARSDAVIDALIHGQTTWAAANRRRDAIAAAAWRKLWPETDSHGDRIPPRAVAASRAPIDLTGGNGGLF